MHFDMAHIAVITEYSHLQHNISQSYNERVDEFLQERK